MRIAILTEDEHFYAAEGIRALLSELRGDIRPALAVIANFSPAGSKTSQLATASYLCRTFGVAPFLRAGLQYLAFGMDRSHRVERVFDDHGIPVLRTEGDVNDGEIVEALDAAKPDLIVSVSMHRLFGSRLLAIAPCLNLHLSLLPRHPGLMPVFWALHAGDRETGVTVHRVDETVDGGAVMVQRRVPIGQRRLEPLYRELKLEGMRALAEAVHAVKDTPDAAGRIQTEPLQLNHAPTRVDVKAFKAGGNRLF